MTSQQQQVQYTYRDFPLLCGNPFRPKDCGPIYPDYSFTIDDRQPSLGWRAVCGGSPTKRCKACLGAENSWYGDITNVADAAYIFGCAMQSYINAISPMDGRIQEKATVQSITTLLLHWALRMREQPQFELTERKAKDINPGVLK